MKVLLINGSPRERGNTFRALNEVAQVLNAEGVETEMVHIGKKPVPGGTGRRGHADHAHLGTQHGLVDTLSADEKGKNAKESTFLVFIYFLFSYFV